MSSNDDAVDSVEFEPHVLRTDEEEGIGRFTVCLADDDHRFEAWGEDGECVVSYQETHSWRGKMEVLPEGPDEDVWEFLYGSEEFTNFLAENEYTAVSRE